MISDSFNRLGIYEEVMKKNYPAAIARYQQALAFDDANKRYRETVVDCSQILNLYFYSGNYPAAMKIATKGLSLAEEHHDRVQMAKYYGIIGFIYLRQGNTSEARKNYTLYLELAEEGKDSLLMADAYSNIGTTDAAGHNYTVALSSLFRACRLYEHQDNVERLANASYSISRVYKEMQDYGQALIYSLKALEGIAKTGYNEYDKAVYLINAGDIYKELSQFGKAIQMTRQGLAIATNIAHREDQQDAWHTLSDIYARQGQYDSAYLYYTLYSALKDSIVNDRSREEIQEIYEQYAVDKKDKEIELQKEQLARQNLWRNIIIVSALLLIVFTLLLVNRRRLKHKADYEMKLNRQRNDLFNAIIMAQDNERKRIARDIHDTLGSLLSAAKLNLSAIDEMNGSSAEERQYTYKTTLALLDEAAIELRNIAHNIMPAGLSQIGLPATIKSVLGSISLSRGLEVQYNVHGFEERLPEPTEISLYRILLELINNVIKHAAASRLTIQLIRHPKYINIVVEDNGTGFDRSFTAEKNKGTGLNNIRSRVDYLKGSMEIDSGKGTGTTVMIEIPV
ncbi:MAG TPA: tetratricopeptide repeat protein [Chitinophagaceae bacterium]